MINHMKISHLIFHPAYGLCSGRGRAPGFL